MAERLGHARVGSRIEPGLHAVARDVGVDEVHEARLGHRAGELGRIDTGSLDPARHRHLAVFRVDAGGQTIPAHQLDGRARQGGIVHERGAQHHARRTDVRQALERLERPDAAADLHLEGRLAHDALDDGGIFWRARARAVEVDDVHPFGARVDERARLGDGIVVVDGHLGVIALLQSDGLAAQDVDRRKQIHLAHAPSTMRTKLRSTAAPASELFSGWNCTPKHRSPYWTALGNATLCTVSPTTNGPVGAM